MKIRRTALKQEVREFIKFNLAGAAAIGTDYGVYNLLVLFLLSAPAKAISFTCGGITAFLINKYWTFNLHGFDVGEIVRYLVVMGAGIGLNVGVNELVLRLIVENRNIAFVAAVAISGLSIFLGQKFWVFRKRGEEA